MRAGTGASATISRLTATSTQASRQAGRHASRQAQHELVSPASSGGQPADSLCQAQ